MVTSHWLLGVVSGQKQHRLKAPQFPPSYQTSPMHLPPSPGFNAFTPAGWFSDDGWVITLIKIIEGCNQDCLVKRGRGF